MLLSSDYKEFTAMKLSGVDEFLKDEMPLALLLWEGSLGVMYTLFLLENINVYVYIYVYI